MAYLLVGTQKFLRVLSSVGLATLLRQTHLSSIHVDVSRIAAIAASTVLAVDNDLWGDADVWPGSLPDDIKAIGNHTGGSFYPTGTTVMRGSLVLGP
jgi:hypothetical protein